MYIRIRNLHAKNGEKDVLLIISKNMKIKQIREMIQEKLNIEPLKQKLYYKGKLLVDDHCVYDYDVKLNDVIQLTINENVENDKDEIKPEESNIKNENDASPTVVLVQAESLYYKKGDKIDYRDVSKQWLEGEILDILRSNSATTSDEKTLTFKIKLEGTENCPPFDAEFDDIRPRSYHCFKSSQLSVGMTVMINYNLDDPKSLGYWYDFQITLLNRKYLKGTLFLDKQRTPLKNITVNLKESTKIWRIEIEKLLSERPDDNINYSKLRELPYHCKHCKDDVSVKCKHCGCKICQLKTDWDNILLCDECDLEYHTYCLDPPLDKVPDDPEWYCPSCKIDESEIVKPGENLKKTKAKKDKATRDWGRGMACVGNTSKCTIVAKNHVGSVPGVEVGTCWKFRYQVSEAGIHRPLVAGIHGRENHCAYSIVLSGGYEDDVDNGEEFYYTGSGGRDLSGNKRENAQSSDQKLTALNKALASNCNTKFDPINGGEAKDWRKGKPVRVVRNYKLSKHSKYAPKEGNRYDGIYKVVKYFPEKGLSGFIVWKFLLRRDDPSIAPWKSKQEPIVLYPEGYLEAEEEKKRAKVSGSKTSQLNKKRKRNSNNEQAQTLLNFVTSPNKKSKTTFTLDNETQNLINEDEKNAKFWNECKEALLLGKMEFLQKVKDLFMCICCQELVYLPITTECIHNICKECLKRSFTASIYNCPICRYELGQKYKMQINDNLQKALMALFPGYDQSR